MPPAPGPGPSVAIVAYDGLCLFDFSVAMEIFGEHGGPSPPGWYERRAVSLEGPAIRTDSGFRLELDDGPDIVRAAHTIIVPGWRMAPVPEHITGPLQAAHRRGARIVSMCTGAFVLGAAGLLDGRPAATHWRYAEALSRAAPAALVDPSALYIDDGDILTSAGSTAGTDLLLHIIRKDFGSAASNTVARGMVAAPHRDGGQAQYIPQPVPPQGRGRLAEILAEMRGNLAAHYSVDTLARRAAMSPRTFFRKFRGLTGQTPHDWLMAERMRAAKALLEETDLSIDHIAHAAGFGAPDTFRRHFRRLVGTTPTRFRLTFRGPAASPPQAA